MAVSEFSWTAEKKKYKNDSLQALGLTCLRFSSKIAAVHTNAEVVKLADALDSGSSGSDPVGVQIPPSAQQRATFTRSGTPVEVGWL